jgi:hypothetical protein
MQTDCGVRGSALLTTSNCLNTNLNFPDEYLHHQISTPVLNEAISNTLLSLRTLQHFADERKKI